MNRLALWVGVPHPERTGAVVQVRPVVDGWDLLGDEFSEGAGEPPEVLLVPDGPLVPGDEPREVRIAVGRCSEACCGALYVTVRRDGDHVVWEGWRQPVQEELELPVFRFAAEQYLGEVERAAQDTGWQWPAWTASSLLDRRLRDAPGVLRRWGFELEAVRAYAWLPDEVSVYLLDGEGRRTRAVLPAAGPLFELLATTDPRVFSRGTGL